MDNQREAITLASHVQTVNTSVITVDLDWTRPSLLVLFIQCKMLFDSGSKDVALS